MDAAYLVRGFDGLDQSLNIMINRQSNFGLMSGGARKEYVFGLSWKNTW